MAARAQIVSASPLLNVAYRGVTTMPARKKRLCLFSPSHGALA